MRNHVIFSSSWSLVQQAMSYEDDIDVLELFLAKYEVDDEDERR